MKKLIAKTQDGKEFLHSKANSFFASSNAQNITNALNKIRYKLSNGEKWFVYDYDYTQDFYVSQRIYISRAGMIRATSL